MIKFRTKFLIAALGVMLPLAVVFAIGGKGGEQQSVSVEETHTKIATATTMALPVSELCNHEYTERKVEPTCTEQGYTLYTCSICGETKKDNYIKEKGHDYNETHILPTL